MNSSNKIMPTKIKKYKNSQVKLCKKTKTQLCARKLKNAKNMNQNDYYYEYQKVKKFQSKIL